MKIQIQTIINRIRNRSLIYATILVAVGIGIGFAFMPPFSDDIGYMLSFRDYINFGEGDWFTIARDTIEWRYIYDNPRLGNVIMILLALVPRWLQALLSSFAVFIIMYEGIHICGMQKNFFGCSLWIAGLLLFFPWIDQMYLFDLQLNYIWPCALSLWLLDRIFVGRTSWVANFFIGLIASLFHEIYGGGLAAALAWLMIRKKTFRERQVVAAFVGVILGLLYVMFPRLHFSPHVDFAGRQTILFLYLFPLILFIVLWLICKRKPAGHTAMKLETLMVISVTGIGLMLIVPIGPRVGSFGITAAVLGSAVLMPVPRNSILRVTGIAILWFFMIIHLFAVDRESYLAGEYTRDAIEKYHKAPDSAVFVDMRLREESPFICLQKPYYGWLAHQCNTEMMTAYYSIDDKWMKVVPSRLQNFKESKAKPIAGNAGLFVYDGLLVGPIDNSDATAATLSVDYGNGTFMELFYTVAFAKNKYGAYYAWFYPEDSTLRQLIKLHPVRADIVDL